MNLKVILTCMSLMFKDVEHLFKCLSVILVPLLKILCLDKYPVFKLDYMVFLKSSFLNALYILGISLLLDVGKLLK